MSKLRVKNLSFPGEASFIVRRRGNKKFLSVVGAVSPVADDAGGSGVVLNPPVLGDSGGILSYPPTVIETYAWDSMDCPSVKNAIASIENLLLTGKYSAEVIAAYQSEIVKGKAVYDTRCLIKQPASDTIQPANPPASTPPGTTTITTSALPVFVAPQAGGTLGGAKVSGGGGGSSTSGTAVVASKKANWWWLLVAAGIIYVVAKKMK